MSLWEHDCANTHGEEVSLVCEVSEKWETERDLLVQHEGRMTTREHDFSRARFPYDANGEPMIHSLRLVCKYCGEPMPDPSFGPYEPTGCPGEAPTKEAPRE